MWIVGSEVYFTEAKEKDVPQEKLLRALAHHCCINIDEIEARSGMFSYTFGGSERCCRPCERSEDLYTFSRAFPGSLASVGAWSCNRSF